MSPKPIDVPRALRTLREERPDIQATDRARAAVQHPLSSGRDRGGVSRRSLARPLAFAMITAALALVLIMPRAKAGSAWAQTLAASFDSIPSYSVSRDAQGHIGYEEWRSGRKRAHVLYDRTHKPSMEWRDDGRRLYNFAGYRFVGHAANARPFGDVSRSPGLGTLDDELPVGSPEALLKQPGVEVVSHEEASSGRPETYRLSIPRPYRKDKEVQVVEIDPKSGRIARLGYPGHEGGTVIAYPASIPDAIFDPRPHAIPDVMIFTKADGDRIQRTLRLGIAKRGPVTLRAVVLTGDGDLWAFWTGALPDPKLAHPYSIPGVRCGYPFTNKIFTTAWRQSPKMNGVPAPVEGPRLGGMGRTPLAKLGPTVDLDVPYPGGVAHFRNVRYSRIGLIQHVSDILGARRDYR